MPRICLLQGRPGSGKTMVATLTAPKKPVILIDADRKARSTTMLEPAVKAGDLKILEITEPLVPSRMDNRARALTRNEKPSQAPQGWVQFATIVENLFLEADKTKEAPGGTLVIDSWTQLNDHLKRFIIYHDDRGHATLNDRNWGTYLNMNTEAIVALKDACAKWDMDLIITVHERVSDMPTPRTQSKRVVVEGQSRRVMEGDVQAIVSPSIEGQFGNIMPAYFAEVYQTYVDVDHNGVPTWKMRIKPDSLRDLRTSIDTKDLVVDPDLSKLWK
jgi:hypothetical protein